MTKSSQFHLFPSKNMNEYNVVMVFVSSILTTTTKNKIMLKIKENDIFEKNMSSQELYQSWMKLKAKKEMDKFLNKLIKKNGTTEY